MKMTAIGADSPGSLSNIARQRRPVQAVKRSGKAPISLSPRTGIALARRAGNASSMRWLVAKLLLLVAVVLMIVSIMQKPSILLLCFMPMAMTAIAVRLLVGLLAAIAIKACTPNLMRRSRAFFPGGWRTFLALALTIALLALMYNIFGSAPFCRLRAADVVGHKAYVTQLVAFTLLWLAVLR